MQPETRYASVDGATVGYQIAGDGPIDVAFIMGVGSHLETRWDVPPLAAALERMASFGRLISFDRRGVGISDPVLPDDLPTWESMAEDFKAVLDAVESERTAIIAGWDSAALAMVFAATYPERTSALVLWTPVARLEHGPDYPMGIDIATLDPVLDMMSSSWGSPQAAAFALPHYAGDEAVLNAYARWMRSASPPGVARRLFGGAFSTDVRHALPLITAPTLVLSREQSLFISEAHSRYVAEHIPGARYVVLPGSEGAFWGSSDTDEILDLVEEFLTGSKPSAPTDRVLATVVFTDIVSSTERIAQIGDRRWRSILEAHDRKSKWVVDKHKGRLVKTTGDGILAVFDGPGRAVQCALNLVPALREDDLHIRSGLHMGEVERMSGGDIGGLSVHIGARVMSCAGPDEVLCSRTVRDVVDGTGFAFEDRGTHRLKGLPDEWQLFAVKAS